MIDSTFAQVREVLALLPQAAFLLDGDEIVYRNRPAGLLLPSGNFDEPVRVPDDQSDPETQYSVYVQGRCYSALIQPCCGGTLVLFERENSGLPESYLQKLSAILAEPVGEMILAASGLYQELAEQEMSPAVTRELSSVYRGLYRLRRLASQLADAGRTVLDQSTAQYRVMDMREYFRQMVENAEDILGYCHLGFRFAGLDQYCPAEVDTHLMERAVWNLIANAAENSRPGQEVALLLEKKGDFLIIHVENQKNDLADEAVTQAFASYQAEPNPLDPVQKLGFGLSIARRVAALHGGTSMFLVGAEVIRVSMSIRLHKPKVPKVFCRDTLPVTHEMEPARRCLLELSGVLPVEAYNPIDLEG